MSSSGCSDLFSEIHGGLADRVSELEMEKADLSQKLEDSYKSFILLISPLFQKLDIHFGTHLISKHK